MGFNAMVRAEDVASVAVLGGGVIGTGWAVHFLQTGKTVQCWDPNPDARSALPESVATLWAIAQPDIDFSDVEARLVICKTLENALTGAGFIQESAPEKLQIKQQLFAQIDALADPGVVVASSTSGLLMTDMQAGAQHPERFVIGHPFNPPWLIPLVEVCGGNATAPAAVDWLEAFYQSCNKEVMRVLKEKPGLVVNRLQDAVFREAVELIATGYATVEQIDQAIAQGPAMRWVFNGPMEGTELGWTGGLAAYADYCLSDDGPGKDWFDNEEDISRLKTSFYEASKTMTAGKDLQVSRVARLTNIARLNTYLKQTDLR